MLYSGARVKCDQALRHKMKRHADTNDEVVHSKYLAHRPLGNGNATRCKLELVREDGVVSLVLLAEAKLDGLQVRCGGLTLAQLL